MICCCDVVVCWLWIGCPCLVLFLLGVSVFVVVNCCVLLIVVCCDLLCCVVDVFLLLLVGCVVFV